MSDRPNGPESSSRYLSYILLAMVLGLVIFVRVRLLQAPLERDEGEFAYMGQLLLEGIPPYAAAYTMKLPGVSFMYALFMLFFGQTITAVHIGLLVVNLASVGLVYFLASRFLDRDAALFSCAAYALLSLSQTVYGVYAHATHFVVLFSLTGFVLLFRYLEKGRILILSAAGLCFGMSFLMKQHAAPIICFAFLYMLRHLRRNSPGNKYGWMYPSLSFLLGVAIPYALVALYLAVEGVFSKFWFWTVEYAGAYVSEMTVTQGWENFSGTFFPMVISQLPIWLLTVTGGVLLYSKQKGSLDRFFLSGFLVASVLAVCPGWYFRQHYYILLLPAAALLAGVAASSVRKLPLAKRSSFLQKVMPAFLFVTVMAYGIYYERDYCFRLNPQQVTRATYGPSPFPEAVKIARYLKEHTDKSDRIAVFGSEPEIFFYSDRLSATRHIYMYGLMENQPYAARMQREMISDIEKAKPKYLVMVNLPSSWGATTSSLTKIINWGESFAAERYELAGIVDIVDFYTTLYIWGDKSKRHKPDSEVFVTVLKRKEKEQRIGSDSAR